MAFRHPLGCVKDSRDDRDLMTIYSREVLNFLGISAPSKVSLKDYVPKVYNQGDYESCTANAVCGAYGIDLTIQPQSVYFDPSRMFLWYNTRKMNGNENKNAGTSIRDAFKSTNQLGICTEEEWPYSKPFNEEPSEEAYSAARGNGTVRYERINTGDLDHIKASLLENCPVVIGMEWYRSFDKIGSDGMMPPPADGVRGRHAVVVVGYDNSIERLTVLNSWGSAIEDEGYFYMPYNFITDNLCKFDMWKAIFTVESPPLLPIQLTAASGDVASACTMKIVNETKVDLHLERHYVKCMEKPCRPTCSIALSQTGSFLCHGNTGGVASWRVGTSSLNLVVLWSPPKDSSSLLPSLAVGYKDSDYPPTMDDTVYMEMLTGSSQTWFKRAHGPVEIVDGSKKYKVRCEFESKDKVVKVIVCKLN